MNYIHQIFSKSDSALVSLKPYSSTAKYLTTLSSR